MRTARDLTTIGAALVIACGGAHASGNSNGRPTTSHAGRLCARMKAGDSRPDPGPKRVLSPQMLESLDARCAAPRQARAVYANGDELRALVTGVWISCSSTRSPSGELHYRSGMEFTPDGRWYRLRVEADGQIARETNRDYEDKNAGLYEAVDDIIGEGNAPLGPGPGIALATDGDGNDCKRAMAYKPEFSWQPRTSNLTGEGRAVPLEPPY